MPYCPKCDMEFIEGITICSDCGAPLMESEEAAKAAKREHEEQERQAQLTAHKEMMLQEEDIEADPNESTSARPPIAPTGLYIKKEQKYEDLKSSATAFLIVGAFLAGASILCWIGIINLPMPGVTKTIIQTALTILGLLSITISASSYKSAQKLAPQIAAETKATKELIQWFLNTYTPDNIDESIQSVEDLNPQELTLIRFQLIQDLLITHHDLPDPAYVDMLTEEIYSALFN